LPSEKSRIILEIQSQDDLTSQSWVFKKLKLSAPKGRIGLRVNYNFLCLEYALGLGFNPNGGLTLIDRRQTEHLDCNQRRHHDHEAKNQPLPLQNNEQIIADTGGLNRRYAIGLRLSNLGERPIHGSLKSTNRH